MKFFLLSISIFIIHCTTAQNFQWAKSYGGPNLEGINSTCIDASGNVYSIGSFIDVVDFDPGPGTYTLSTGIFSYTDIYVLKLDALGNFVWAKKIGGNFDYDFPGYISVDNNGDLVITGYFSSTADFDPDAPIYNLTSAGNYDAFILKLNSQGNFIWAQRIGGINDDSSGPIAIDNLNNIYFAGNYSGAIDLNPESGVLNVVSNGSNEDVFIEKLNSNGNFIWAKSFGGIEKEYCSSLCVDANNNLYAIGTFSGTVDFDPNIAVVNKISNGGKDVFMEKFDNSGNLVWVNTFGGTNDDDVSWDLKIDSQNNLYMGVNFQNTVDFDPSGGFFNITSVGAYDICIQKSDASGNFVWAKHIGSANNESLNVMDLRNSTNLFFAGYFDGTVDFDPSSAVYNLTSNVGGDIFIQSLDKNGNFLWVKTIGNIDYESVYCLSVDNNNNLFVGGIFNSTLDFDPSSSTFNLTPNVNGAGDDFILKLSQETIGIMENNNLVLKSSLYPNPTTGNFVIVLEEECLHVNVEIYTVTGQLIYQKEYSNTNKINLNIDQPKGIYFVVLQNENGKKSNLKLVKI